MAVKFNIEKPFESIANFCNNSAFFNQKERKVFIEETRQYFGKKAYWDEDVVIPRIIKSDFLRCGYPSRHLLSSPLRKNASACDYSESDKLPF